MTTGDREWTVLHLSKEERLALVLLATIGAAALTTSVGPGQVIKRRIETKHKVEIDIESVKSALQKLQVPET